MKKDFIVRRSITMVEGKPHVETYSEQELIRCKDCKKHGDIGCPLWTDAVEFETEDNWFCADGTRKDR